MSISYEDSKRTEPKPRASGLILAAILAIGGLLWFGPQTTAMFENAITNMIRLPIF